MQYKKIFLSSLQSYSYRIIFFLFALWCERVFRNFVAMCAFFYVIAILLIVGLVLYTILAMYGLV